MKEQKKESLLDNLCIAAPCSIAWESMQGDNRKRECGGCSRSVFNISDMTKSEAELFLRENAQAPPCMIFYRRHDGTVMTDNCPVGLRKLRDRCRAVVRAASAVVAFFLSWTCAHGQTQKDLGKSTLIRSHVSGSAPFGGEPLPPDRPLIDLRKTEKPNDSASTPATQAVEVQHHATAGKPMMHTPNPGQMLVPPRLMGGAPVALPRNLPDMGRVSTVNNNGNGKVKLHAEYSVYMEAKALELYNKGQAAAASGNKSLATFYFEKSLDAFDAQSKGDRKFRERIEKALKALDEPSK